MATVKNVVTSIYRLCWKLKTFIQTKSDITNRIWKIQILHFLTS